MTTPRKEERCCEKCIIDLDYKPAQCNNRDCPCHKDLAVIEKYQAEWRKEAEHRKDLAAHDREWVFVGTINEVGEDGKWKMPQNAPQEWEEEWRKLCKNLKGEPAELANLIFQGERLISSLLTRERARLEEEIGGRCWEHEKQARDEERERIVEIAEGMKKELQWGESPHGGTSANEIYNAALTTLITKLRDEK